MIAVLNKRELQYRVANQLSSLKLGNMIKWCQSTANRQRLEQYIQRFTCQNAPGEEREKAIWRELRQDNSVSVFFRSLGISGKELRRRGEAGDIYAGHVFCALAQYILDVSRHITDNNLFVQNSRHKN